jgi:hypothetical protein
MARAYLDMDPSDEYPGVVSFRDEATRKGLTPQEVGPLALANQEVLKNAFGALSVEQEKLNFEAGSSLGLGKEVTAYFESKNEVMSQGGLIQTTLQKVRHYTGELEKALALPVTDSSRDQAVRSARNELDSYLKILGQDPVARLEKNRKAVIEGLNNAGDLVGSVPTPFTRGRRPAEDHRQWSGVRQRRHQWEAVLAQGGGRGHRRRRGPVQPAAAGRDQVRHGRRVRVLQDARGRAGQD